MRKLPLFDLFATSIDAHSTFRSKWQPFEDDETIAQSPDTMLPILETLRERLMKNYPFHHPNYAGQMLKPPHPIAMAAYLMAMQINPNNHALDGGPATAEMELEIIEQFAKMFEFEQAFGHLTSNGTVANLEALWVSRNIHPSKGIAVSKSAHYTHKRMSQVLSMECTEIMTDRRHHMDHNHVEEVLSSGTIGTLVVTLGTTGVGAIDQLHELLPICRKYGARIHADCAYGGFFKILANEQNPIIDPIPFIALKEVDSIVIDPHKHGLQPYGCGSVLFKDPGVGKFYKHDSPYTYFTSKSLHLGEISLECSRPGAAAAALWATLQLFPLQLNGLGSILRKTRKAALRWNTLMTESESYRMFTDPELDIVTYFPIRKCDSASKITAKVNSIFEQTMNDPKYPIFLAKFQVDSGHLTEKFPEIKADTDTTIILRSTLMKPEHEKAVDHIVQSLHSIS